MTPLDHTGDVGFELGAPDLAALFDAARAALLSELMTSPPAAPQEAEGAARPGGEVTPVSLEAPAVDRLLLRWLDELLYQVQTCQRVPARAELRIVPPTVGGSAWHLTARLQSVPLDTSAHGWRGEVKGATYHGLEVTRRRGGWRARVILDV